MVLFSRTPKRQNHFYKPKPSDADAIRQDFEKIISIDTIKPTKTDKRLSQE